MSAATLDRIALDAVVDMAGGDAAALLEELFESFMASANTCVANIRAAAATRDARALFQAAHALKGAAANLGLARTAELASDLELLGRAGTVEDCAPAVDALVDEVSRGRDAVRRYIDARR